MPWRAIRPKKPNPYHVLVSEAMLQQTQVATVIPYFNRFMKQLPTVQALAEADEQQVLKLWQGLGYYSRARHLHATAKRIVADHGGKVPNDLDALLDLPGIGRYTAGAIGSIAHNLPVPILDGNVARVLSRWFAIREPIDDAKVKDRLWSLAEEVVDPDDPGDFNQAMMDLGAMVCSVKQPACLMCPMAGNCEAASEGIADELPVRAPRRKPTAVTHTVVAVHRRDTWLFERRGQKGLWANMWQFVTCEDPVPDIAVWVNNHTGLRVAKPKQAGSFTHQTTHRTIRFELFQAQATGGRLRPKVGQWRKLTQLEDLPMANPQREVVKLLKLSHRSG